MVHASSPATSKRTPPKKQHPDGLHCTEGCGSICSVSLLEATGRVCAGKDNGKAIMSKIAEAWDQPGSEAWGDLD